jgi:hypothetical protein
MKFALVLLSLPFAVFAEPDSKQAKASPTPLDATLTDPAFFTKPLAEVYQTYHKQATPEVKERQEKHRANARKGRRSSSAGGFRSKWPTGPARADFS